MAGADTMTIEEVVRKVLLDEHANVICESVSAVAAEMMELEVSELIGAGRAERRPGSRDASQRLSPAALNARAGEISTRRVDQLVESLGLRMRNSEVSRVCEALDEHVDAFRTRPLEGRYPYPRGGGHRGAPAPRKPRPASSRCIEPPWTMLPPRRDRDGAPGS